MVLGVGLQMADLFSLFSLAGFVFSHVFSHVFSFFLKKKKKKTSSIKQHVKPTFQQIR